ncbi:hypothetical protein EPN90_03345 [Patescibacteria group bacterium]|nr:MAG: hypothetical protein EPN90_03345 [Patescibacteria group bacterium]
MRFYLLISGISLTLAAAAGVFLSRAFEPWPTEQFFLLLALFGLVLFLPSIAESDEEEAIFVSKAVSLGLLVFSVAGALFYRSDASAPFLLLAAFLGITGYAAAQKEAFKLSREIVSWEESN